MRVLLINPEFPPSFWTLEQSRQFLGHKTLMPPLGLITLAALLPSEWELRLADLNTRQLRTADWDWAEIVMLSGMIVQRDGLLHLIREAKARGKTVVVGGPYATSVPEEILVAGADFLVRGEAEQILPRWLAAFTAGEKQGVFAADARPEMSMSPVPRFDLLHLDDYITLGIQTSRGCPFNCEFCDIINLYGRRPRYKNPHQVLAELDALHALGWRREIFISDDNFIGNQDHARAILTELIPWLKDHGEPFSFWTQASADLGQNLPLVDLLTAANFGNIFIGVESPDEDVLAGNRKYQNLKNPLDQSLTNICANGLAVIPSFILGFDQEKKGAGDRICAFVEKNNLPAVMLNLLQAIPHTGLWNRLQSEDRLLPTGPCADMINTSFNFRPARPEAEIVDEYIRAIDYLYEPSKYLARTFHYFLTMRPTRAFTAANAGKAQRTAHKKGQLPFNARLEELTGLLRLVWRQGIAAPYRGQFWRQLAGIYRQNPSRLKKYLTMCVMGENLFRIREGVLEKAARDK